jgi:hypothetical protein
MEKKNAQAGSHIEAFIPIGIQSLFDHACCVGLLSIDSDDSETDRAV